MKTSLSRRTLTVGIASLLSTAPLVAKAGEKGLPGAGGSPNGTTEILAGINDFAILESPLSDAQLTSSNLYRFPLAFAAIVFVANIPGMASNRLRLTGPLPGGSYSG